VALAEPDKKLAAADIDPFALRGAEYLAHKSGKLFCRSHRWFQVSGESIATGDRRMEEWSAGVMEY
jgi:hypothetical protein